MISFDLAAFGRRFVSPWGHFVDLIPPEYARLPKNLLTLPDYFAYPDEER